MITRQANESDLRRLGLDRGASETEIKTAFRKLARLYHPDHNRSADAAKHFAAVRESYELLLAAKRNPDAQTTIVGKPVPWYFQAREGAGHTALPSIEHLRVGDARYVASDTVLVAADSSCSLRPGVIGSDHAAAGHPVKVVRDKDGFRVILPESGRHLWEVSTEVGLRVTQLWVGGKRVPSARGRGAAERPQMPDWLLAEPVIKMPANSDRWVVSAALRVDGQGQCWLNLRAATTGKPSLLTPVRIRHDGSRYHAKSTFAPNAFTETSGTPEGEWSNNLIADLGGFRLGIPTSV